LVRRSLLVLAVAALALAVGASSAVAFKGFETPSHNIGCILTEQTARCDIRDHSWADPKKPTSCEFDYGGSLFVGKQGRGRFGCVSDSAMGAGPVLAYGEQVRKGRFVCTSEEAGVRCVNRRNGHGFFVSRQHVQLF
jgi:hypothetical protein